MQRALEGPHRVLVDGNVAVALSEFESTLFVRWFSLAHGDIARSLGTVALRVSSPVCDAQLVGGVLAFAQRINLRGRFEGPTAQRFPLVQRNAEGPWREVLDCTRVFAHSRGGVETAVHALLRCDMRLRCAGSAIIGGPSNRRARTTSSLSYATHEFNEASETSSLLVLRFPVARDRSPTAVAFDPHVSAAAALRWAEACEAQTRGVSRGRATHRSRKHRLL